MPGILYLFFWRFRFGILPKIEVIYLLNALAKSGAQGGRRHSPGPVPAGVAWVVHTGRVPQAKKILQGS